MGGKDRNYKKLYLIALRYLGNYTNCPVKICSVKELSCKEIREGACSINPEYCWDLFLNSEATDERG